MNGCTCNTPRPSSDPRKLTDCVVCGRYVRPEWSSSQIGAMIDRLKDIPEVQTSRVFQGLRDLCVRREEAGRDQFGFRFLGRNNEQDVREEIADGINYQLFGTIRRRREGKEPYDEMALTGAFHAVRWYEANCEIERKLRGVS